MCERSLKILLSNSRVWIATELQSLQKPREEMLLLHVGSSIPQQATSFNGTATYPLSPVQDCVVIICGGEVQDTMTGTADMPNGERI